MERVAFPIEESEQVHCLFCAEAGDRRVYGRGEAFLQGPECPPYNGEANYVCKRHLDPDAQVRFPRPLDYDTPAPLCSDAHIEYWGCVFTVLDLFHRFGVRFETFVLYPREILAAVCHAARDRAPLLPRQAQVMHRQLGRELEEALVPQSAALRGVGYVERLRHHSWAVSQDNHLNRRATV